MGRRQGENVNSGPFRQVSRLGNPLVNEVLIPLGSKDLWNSLPPKDDKQFALLRRPSRARRAAARALPGRVPEPGEAGQAATARADLEAILLTGIPTGIVPGFQNYTGPEQADMLRLNTAIKPAQEAERLGLIGGDPAGFPNGRRVFDDVVTIELRAIAGVTYPLVNPKYKPDAAAGAVTDGLTARASPAAT